MTARKSNSVVKKGKKQSTAKTELEALRTSISTTLGNDSSNPSPESDAPLYEARLHIQLAAQILKNEKPDLARIAWLLEDTLLLLDQSEQGLEEAFSPENLFDAE